MQKIGIESGKVEQEDRTHLSTKAMPIQCEAETDDFIEDVRRKLEKHIEKYTTKGSNWTVAAIEEIAVRIVKYRLLRGGVSNFKMPPELIGKYCVLNIESKSKNCIKYAIIASLHHKEAAQQRDKNRHTNYDPFFPQYDFTGMEFP